MTATRRIHVAIVHRRYAGLILAGRKTAECRLSRTRRAPFGAVAPGDRIYLKISSGPFAATAVAGDVESLENLTPAAVDGLRSRWQPRVLGDDAFWAERRAARVATLVGLRDAEPIDRGPDYRDIAGPGSRSAWIVLPADRDVYPACVAPTLHRRVG